MSTCTRGYRGAMLAGYLRNPDERKIMSDGPNPEQSETLESLREDYGVMRWQVTPGGVVVVVDRDGDEWRIAVDGEPTCVGGYMVAREPEPEEEDA